MKKRVVKSDVCLNCNQELNGENFCPNCGQLNNCAKPTAKQLFYEALENLFAFDSKFYLSIWPLMRRPGQLSLDVVNGQRVKFLPPIRLFLLVTIIMLALNSLTDRFSRSWNDIEHLKPSDESVFVTNADSTNGSNDLQLTFSDDASGNTLEKIYQYVVKHPDNNLEEGLKSLELPNTFWNRFFYSSFLKLTIMKAADFKNYIQSNFLIILLLFIPFVAILLKALYFYKKEYYYVDHFIFSLHTQTAFFVFVIAFIVVSWFFSDWVFLVIFIGFPVYLFLALKRFYKQKKRYTFINFLALNAAFAVVAIFFILFVSLVSFILI